MADQDNPEFPPTTPPSPSPSPAPNRSWPNPLEPEKEWEPFRPDYLPEHVEPDNPWPR